MQHHSHPIDKISARLRYLSHQHRGFIAYEKPILLFLLVLFFGISFLLYTEHKKESELLNEVTASLSLIDQFPGTRGVENGQSLSPQNWLAPYPNAAPSGIQSGVSIAQTDFYLVILWQTIAPLLATFEIGKTVAETWFGKLIFGAIMQKSDAISQQLSFTPNIGLTGWQKSLHLGQSIAETLEKKEDILSQFTFLLSHLQDLAEKDHQTYIASGSTVAERLRRFTEKQKEFDQAEIDANYARKHLKSIIQQLMIERDKAVAAKKQAWVTLSRNIDNNQMTQLNDSHTEYRLASGKVGSYEADIIVFSRMEAEIRRNQQKIRFQRQAYESSFENVVYQEPINMYNKQVPFPFNIIKLKIVGSQLRVENKMTDAVLESLQN